MFVMPARREVDKYKYHRYKMKLYVGNLSYDMTNQDLNDLFNEFGDVDSAKIITDRESGRNRGFGFVEMNDNDGSNAIEQLNGAEIQGRELVVNEARPQVDKGRNGNGYRFN
ncbi:MAG: hypothetical protein Kapaf2KO_00170 [Candidatus Kapaibacteriales bacterium]